MNNKNIDYSIYDWYNDLSYYQQDNIIVDDMLLKKQCDHFIGYGIFDYIYIMLIDFYKKFNNLDINKLKSEFSNLSSVIPIELNISVYCAISYNQYYEDNINYLSGTMPIYSKGFDIKYKIINIIRDIVSPTLYYSGNQIRQSLEQRYVIDDKYKCVNFSVNDYDVFNNTNYIMDINNYSVHKVINAYKPVIELNIENSITPYSSSGMFSLNDFEKKLDQILNNILNDIHYSNIIFDYHRNNRDYIIPTYVNRYTMKIIL